MRAVFVSAFQFTVEVIAGLLGAALAVAVVVATICLAIVALVLVLSVVGVVAKGLRTAWARRRRTS